MTAQRQIAVSHRDEGFQSLKACMRRDRSFLKGMCSHYVSLSLSCIQTVFCSRRGCHESMALSMGAGVRTSEGRARYLVLLGGRSSARLRPIMVIRHRRTDGSLQNYVRSRATAEAIEVNV